MAVTSPSLKTKAIHLYRALLRAATYLPDSRARSFTHQQIRQRFRNSYTITPSRLSNAKATVGVLQRAANGELKPLTSVLLHTYGRTGRRRRELVAKMLRPEGTVATIERAEVERLATPPAWLASNGDLQTERPAFNALLRSQLQNSPPETLKPKLKRLTPQIPKENIWGRTVALKVQVNLKKKFWSSTLDKMLPPLPEPEWNRLRDLATGAVRFKGPPPRRPMALDSKNLISVTPNLDRLLSNASRHGQLENRFEKDMHHLTPRFMQRIWAGIWSQCPVMSRDENKMENWIVVWGGSRSAASQAKISNASARDMELFDGVDKLDTLPSKIGPRAKKRVAQKYGKEYLAKTDLASLKPVGG